ncbi:2-hydroxyacyl-CoA dehydratase [Sedimentibacter hydroxybenzoicus DSM 7310]|uniref:2-hydroxyacyl-CoA dehydratase n=1 Tax=Sedimentibacter hydroxybenzoicus DSM 7310 TaxID=1123245 RepID=A0A974BHN0_SEDHY|nr:2-hydroxyacyl-CoA dehydratase family protein [Sedimentibacter hydroxybenzoicus]NYB73302.1 2-hydroxyacyl-CoA dehydratase [Sedimentibacter hydroxybenzoicus DSM 7310]
MENLYNLLEEFQEARRNAYVDAIYLKSHSKHVAGIFGKNIPREILWALDITPVNVYSIDGSNIAASYGILDKENCSVVKSSYGYTATERCPLIYSADIIISNDMCPHKTLMISKIDKLKDIYIIKDSKNAAGLESEYRKFVDFIENKFSVKLNENKLNAAIDKVNSISDITTKIINMYMERKCPINVYDLYNIIYGSQFILNLDERYSKLSEIHNILKESLSIDVFNKNNKAKIILITGAPLAGLTEEILRPLSQNKDIFVIFSTSLCEGENYTPVKLCDNPYMALANKYVNNDDAVKENFKENISQIIDVRLSGCNVLLEPNHHLPYLSLTANYGDNIEEIKMFPKQ